MMGPNLSGLAISAKEDLKEIRKQLEIANIIKLADIRHKAWLNSLHLPNGAELDEDGYYELVEELWKTLVEE